MKPDHIVKKIPWQTIGENTRRTARHVNSYLLSRQKAVLLFFVLSVAIISFICLILLPAVFSSRSGIPAEITVTSGQGSGEYNPYYSASETEDRMVIRNISSGRYQIRVDDTGVNELYIDFTFDGKQQYIPRRLVVRSSSAQISTVQVYTVAGGDTSRIGTADFEAGTGKTVQGYHVKSYIVPLESDTPADRISLIVKRSAQPANIPKVPYIIEDIGLYETSEGPLYDNRMFMKHTPIDLFNVKIYYELICLAFVSFLMTLLITGKRNASISIPVYVFVVASTITTFELYTGFPSGAENEDLRTIGSTISFQGEGANLNWGLFMASNMMTGKGLTPYWNRMPGYGLLSAIAGFTAGDFTNVARMSIHMVFLQIAFFAVAITFFAWSAIKIMSHRAAALISTIICYMPNHFFFTQVDSIMISVAILVTGVLFLYIRKDEDCDKVPLINHLLVHAAFAFWFLMRPDVLPGWMIISVVIHRRSWRHYLIPVIFFLVIGLAWGTYKYKKIGEFNMTTASFGASAFVGLWEVPHKFVWETSDGSTFKLGEILEVDATRKDGSSRFIKEVFRFYFTYPVYTLSLFFHEFMQFIFHQSFSGYYFVIFQVLVRYCMMNFSVPLILLTIALLSFVYRYRAKQTLLLGWSVFFNLPFFFLIYSSGGRFYPPHGVAMLAFSAPLLFDVNFYKHISLMA